MRHGLADWLTMKITFVAAHLPGLLTCSWTAIFLHLAITFGSFCLHINILCFSYITLPRTSRPSLQVSYLPIVSQFHAWLLRSLSCEHALILGVPTRSELDWFCYLKVGFVKAFTPGSIFMVNSSQAFSNYTRLFIASLVERCQNVNKLCDVSQLESGLSSDEHKLLPGSASCSAVWVGGSLECQPRRWTVSWGSVCKINTQKTAKNIIRRWTNTGRCQLHSKREKQHNPSRVQSVAPQWGHLLFKVVLRLS